MKKIAGYADRWSVAAGDTISFMVSSSADLPFDVELVRVICGDPNPSGPGYSEIPMRAPCCGRHQGRFRDIAPGSYGEAAVNLEGYGRLRFGITAWPSRIGDDDGLLWSLATQDLDLWLEHGPQGVTARMESAGASAVALTGRPLLPRRWYDLELVVDFAARKLRLSQRPHAAVPGETGAFAECAVAATSVGQGLLRFGGAARDGIARGLFNGKLQDPWIRGGRVDGGDEIVAHWDFSVGIAGEDLADLGPNGWHGRLCNLPTRAVRGAGWSGRHLRWTEAPAEYGAIHFHKDDLGDVGWPVEFGLTVPDDWPSGLYAARLRNRDGLDEVPFVVKPAPRAPGARVAVLLSTFTYQVYAQWIRPGRGAEIRDIAAAWGALPETPDQHPEYGLSPYNVHADDSSVVMASLRRPMIDKRIRQVSYADPAEGGSGTFWLTADSYIIAWLTGLGIDHDVITDHDLHDGSIDPGSDYDVLITGHHPEYHSRESLDAIGHFLDGGGRLMYLGGNGFYWRVAVPEAMPWAVELRREHGGAAVSATEPGEGCHAADGSPGGLWRRLGFPPQARFGVGFTSQGYYKGYPYKLTDAVHDPRLAFLRADEDPALASGALFGDFGLMGGGAAGLELDRADPLLGTPPHALVIASASVEDPRFVPANEEYITTARPFDPKEYVRSDIVFFETEAKGAVFSVGSMTYLGSLAFNWFDNPVARLTERMLRRMLDRSPFGA